MVGGEIYVKKIPSMRVVDIAKVIAPERKQKIIGVRPGEKMHEQMIGFEDAPFTYEYNSHYKILPSIHSWSLDPNRIGNGKLVNPDFTYTSDNNSEWMSNEYFSQWLKDNISSIGKI
jgi:FlaA1/EpsC-like NDP-sugar epimerase